MDLSDLGYIAPNLPRYTVDSDTFWRWWDSVTIPIKRIQKDSRGNGGGYEGEFWDGVTIWQHESYQRNIVWKINYQPNEALFKDLITRIHQELPWFKILGITLWSNKSRIPPHQDGQPRDLFPSAPRIALLDECDQRTFFIISKRKYKKIVPDLTVGPNLFFFNNETYLHGADEPIGGRKILIRIDGPLVDPIGLENYIQQQLKENAKHEGT
jgi:hypothetical protein